MSGGGTNRYFTCRDPSSGSGTSNNFQGLLPADLYFNVNNNTFNANFRWSAPVTGFYHVALTLHNYGGTGNGRTLITVLGTEVYDVIGITGLQL